MPRFLGLLVRTLLVVYAVVFAPTAQAADGSATRGEKLYGAKCGGCHSIETNRIGPRHRGVFGRTAGTVPDFSYSRALQESEVVWNDESLDSWLTNPAVFIPGQRMFVRVGKADDRADIIAYLKQQSDD